MLRNGANRWVFPLFSTARGYAEFEEYLAKCEIARSNSRHRTQIAISIPRRGPNSKQDRARGGIIDVANSVKF